MSALQDGECGAEMPMCVDPINFLFVRVLAAIAVALGSMAERQHSMDDGVN